MCFAWSALYWLCPPLRVQRCTGSAHRYVVSVVMALPSVAQCALHGQRCTGSARCCTMCVARSALYWLCSALRSGHCVVSVVLALPSVAQCALHGQRCNGSARRCTMCVAWSALYWLCSALHSGRCMVSVAYRCTLCTMNVVCCSTLYWFTSSLYTLHSQRCINSTQRCTLCIA